MKALVAPDSFKGTFSAVEVCGFLSAGLEQAGVEADLCPVADGGEGTAEIVGTALGCKRRQVTVTDALGRPVRAAFFRIENRAYIDLAEASGIGNLDPGELDPIAATTTGTGELIMAAANDGAEVITVSAGGSATVDGGRGAVSAIERSGGIAGVELFVLCDVNTQFEDAAAVFGPQKGAAPEQVEWLTRMLDGLAGEMPADPRGMPMTGAAGGFSGAMWAHFGARLVLGAAFVLDLLDFDRRLREAGAVICGEGRIDHQSLLGKVPGEIAARANRFGVPAFAVAGQVDLSREQIDQAGLTSVFEAGNPELIELAAERIGRAIAAKAQGR